MNQLILYIACSLDGYIADEDGHVEWLDRLHVDGEDYGYEEFYQSIDTLIMGRNTYEKIRLLSSNWVYSGKHTYVLSQREIKPHHNDITPLKGSVLETLDIIENAGAKRTWLVGGGQLVSSYLQHNKIDEFIISTTPTLLGKGIRLFQDCEHPVQDLKLLSCKEYPQSGVLQSHYQRTK